MSQLTPLKSIRELGCPEGFASDIRGWHSDHDFFREIIKEVIPGTIIEVGSWKGASALTMAKLTEPTATTIYCVDSWLGGYEMVIHDDSEPCDTLKKFGYPQVYFQFLSNLFPSEHSHRIFPIPQTSINGSRLLKAHGIWADLIYIDASHQLEDVYIDLCAYWELLRPGGVMFGDDFELDGVSLSVKRFCIERGLPCQLVDEIFWVLRKP